MKFRDLTASEIEIRIGQAKQNGLSLLLYKDARCDMAILDETVGAENWQREHYECKGNLFCRVGIVKGESVKQTAETISLNTREWVWKSDCGTESYTEKEKGEASDSFKRACVNWGIGRELYTSPFIWIAADKCNIEQYDRNGKKAYGCNDKFSVEKIIIEDKKITALAIRNDTTKKRVFVWQKQQ